MLRQTAYILMCTPPSGLSSPYVPRRMLCLHHSVSSPCAPHHLACIIKHSPPNYLSSSRNTSSPNWLVFKIRPPIFVSTQYASHRTAYLHYIFFNARSTSWLFVAMLPLNVFSTSFVPHQTACLHDGGYFIACSAGFRFLVMRTPPNLFRSLYSHSPEFTASNLKYLRLAEIRGELHDKGFAS